MEVNCAIEYFFRVDWEVYHVVVCLFVMGERFLSFVFFDFAVSCDARRGAWLLIAEIKR